MGSLDNLIPYRPGQCGNPNGRPKGRSLTARLRDLLDRAEFDGRTMPSGQCVADLVAEAVIKGALAGDHRFISLLLDRIDGKVADTPPDLVADRAELPRRIIIPDRDARYLKPGE